MDWKVCEYCGKDYDQDELGVDANGYVSHGEYDTLYCSLKCYRAACKVEGSEANVQLQWKKADDESMKEHEAHKARIDAMRNPSKTFCKKCKS